MSKCAICNGSGTAKFRPQGSPFVIESDCRACGGSGRIGVEASTELAEQFDLLKSMVEEYLEEAEAMRDAYKMMMDLLVRTGKMDPKDMQMFSAVQKKMDGLHGSVKRQMSAVKTSIGR